MRGPSRPPALPRASCRTTIRARRRNVLRGLHYQIQRPQGKLVRVVAGEVFDVAVDLRRSSPTFGKWQSAYLSAENKRMLWIPPGFAHGFLVTSEWAEFLYKTTDYWVAEYERTIAWNDPDVAIDWPLQSAARPVCEGRERIALGSGRDLSVSPDPGAAASFRIQASGDASVRHRDHPQRAARDRPLPRVGELCRRADRARLRQHGSHRARSARAWERGSSRRRTGRGSARRRTVPRRLPPATGCCRSMQTNGSVPS